MDANLREFGIHHEATKNTKVMDSTIHNCGVGRREGVGGTGSGGLGIVYGVGSGPQLNECLIMRPDPKSCGLSDQGRGVVAARGGKLEAGLFYDEI